MFSLFLAMLRQRYPMIVQYLMRSSVCSLVQQEKDSLAAQTNRICASFMRVKIILVLRSFFAVS
jgi:hypothetical protein